MSGFNHLFIRPRPVQEIARHFGYGHVNQWWQDDCAKVAFALRVAGCTATLLELFGFWKDKRWENVDGVFRDATKAVLAFKRHGIFIYWTIINWNAGDGTNISICSLRFDDSWWRFVLEGCQMLQRLYPEGQNFLPCSELGIRNKQCITKGMAWHSEAVRRLGQSAVRWNGLGNARPQSGEGLLEWHCASVNDWGFPHGCLVVPDHSRTLDQLGGLKSYVHDHNALRQLVRAAKTRNCGFVHYGYSTPTPDWQAIKTIGATYEELQS